MRHSYDVPRTGILSRMTDGDRRGAAYHEAGHVVVAWSLGLPVGNIAISINGDDAAGKSDIGTAAHLPIVDQLAVCLAGLEAQNLFEAHTHDLAGMGDFAKVLEIIDEDQLSPEQSRALREAGEKRARELLTENKSKVTAVALHLLEHGGLEVGGLLKLLGDRG
jgi:ATP-dependent Zn protease